jgi:hypothetical protein
MTVFLSFWFVRPMCLHPERLRNTFVHPLSSAAKVLKQQQLKEAQKSEKTE